MTIVSNRRPDIQHSVSEREKGVRAAPSRGQFPVLRIVKAILSATFLILIDLCSFAASLLLAAGTYSFIPRLFPDAFPVAPSLTIFTMWWVPSIYIGFFAYERLYQKRFPFWDEPKAILKSLTIASLMVFAIISVSKKSQIDSIYLILLFFFFGSIVCFLFRVVGKKLLTATNIWKEDVLIFGAGTAGTEIARGLMRDKHQGYNVIGFLDDEPGKIDRTIDVDGKKFQNFGKIKKYREIVDRLGISTVILAIPSLSTEKLSNLTNEVQKHVKSVLLVPALKGTSLLNTELYHVFMQQLYLIHISNKLKSPHNRAIKFLFDILVSLLLLPLFLLIVGGIWLAIKLDSPGPVFYYHERIGQGGKPIRVWKFRTMYMDARERLSALLEEDHEAREEWESNYKLKNDPRVTRVGRFLREVSLDELPQLINVLKGEMSLVGPRPVLQEELDCYYKEYADYYCLVRPGITGLWQVSGRSNTTYETRVWLDSWYVINWSIWFDLVILLKTVRVLVQKEGAY
jgi:undecaprenyl-phosphate galactose phosphotransferase